MRELLEEDGNGQMLAQADGQGAADAGFPTLRMHYDDDLNPAPEGTVWMDIQWIPASGQDGDGASPEEGLVKSVITVSRAGAQEPDRGVHRPGLEPGRILGQDKEEGYEAYTD